MKTVRPVEMLPTLVTLGNLFSGFLAIAYLTDSLHSPTDPERIWLYQKAIFLIFLAMVFDAVDGKVARLTGQSSQFGAQVDSICDAISFGAAPALLFKVVAEVDPAGIRPRAALVLAVIFLACCVLRLARFNLETDTDPDAHAGFEGLPTPAAAAVVASLIYLNIELDPERAKSWVVKVIPFLMPALGVLMVSRLPYLHVATWLLRKKTFPMLILLVFTGGFLVLEHEVMIPLLCVTYMLSGPLVYVWMRLKRRNPPEPIF